MSEILYRQCKLIHSTNKYTVAWIESEFAVVEKSLKMWLEDKDNWESGWKVAEVWGTKKISDLQVQKTAEKTFKSKLK